MELRTRINIEPSEYRITYSDRIMFLGSCFATSMGSQLEKGGMNVMINPSGTVYNPVSVINTLDSILGDKQVTIKDLYKQSNLYVSFSHYTSFSSEDPGEVVQKINLRSAEASAFLKSSSFLFITFGTARVYRFRETGKIVSNCHKIPASSFDRELLSVEGIVDLWMQELDRLSSLFPSLKVFFTVSPVRHWKDGAHGNQVSKSVLFLAVEELLKHPAVKGYFPAYELLMDDLRDYRFYDRDMLHPSETAIDYIRDAFMTFFFDNRTIKIWNEVVKIKKAAEHRVQLNSSRVSEFALHMIDEIESVKKEEPAIDLSSEFTYFNSLIKK